jgi:hypothetical protein
MDSQKAHQAVRTDKVRAGVGVEPGGLTPPGGGGKPSPASQKNSKILFARLSQLSRSKTSNQAGQALIELVVIVPVILVIFMCAIPLTAYGIFPTWMDERLALIQLAEKKELAAACLAKTHENSRIPTYPDDESIQESSRNLQTTIFLDSFPGRLSERMVRHELKMPLSRENLLPGSSMPQWSDSTETLTRSLSMLAPHNIEEQAASQRVKEWSLMGVMKGRDFTFRKLNIDLFHMDIDAVPSEEPGEG